MHQFRKLFGRSEGCSYSSIKRLYHSEYSLRTHTCGELRATHVGSHVTLCGWMKRARQLGSEGVVFIPLTDNTGVTQLVCQDKDVVDIVNGLNTESVIKINGVVIARPDGNANKEMATGSIEVQVESLEVLNKATVLPFLPYSKATHISDELMLKERHLHIRTPAVQKVLRFRSQVSNVVRKFLIENGFVEVETPTLFKPTPEGAREFLVPTRDFGRFFSLAQSPQQFKQLLMVGGVDRYFQFARCYRDEDSRMDRQPEFTQIDLEMSFIRQEDIMRLIEDLVIDIQQRLLPDATQLPKPFPVMSYRQAMDQYGSDKPDRRYNMKLHNLSVDWAEGSRSSQCAVVSGLSDFGFVAFHVPQWKEMNKKFSQDDWRHLLSPLADSPDRYATVLSVYKDKIKVIVDADDSTHVSQAVSQYTHDMRELLTKTTSLIEDGTSGAGGYIVALFDNKKHTDEVLKTLGRLRTNIAGTLSTKGIMSLPTGQLDFLWVNKFPLFSIDSSNAAGEHVITSTHHPFTAPVEEDLGLLYSAKTHDDLTKVTAQHYDLVVNGWELGGGSIRIHNPDLQEYVMDKVLKIDTRKFSHLLKAMQHGCPPHGGIALGFDRFIAVLCGLSSVRHVIAFPKSTNGKDLLMGSPAEVSLKELEEYGITLQQRDDQ